MPASTSILPEKLHEYPQQDVIDGSGGESAAVLDDCLNQNDGVLQLLHRYAGRTFCSPKTPSSGRRILPSGLHGRYRTG